MFVDPYCSDSATRLLTMLKPGIVNMADPEYKVELRDESYCLWVSEEYETIMNLNDTNTTYTLSKSLTKTINELLN